MIAWRGMGAIALAGAAAFVAACSSSSGGTPTKFACAENNTAASMENSACGMCLTSSCGSQVSAELGSGYASGDLSGGACGSYFTCIAKCACNDTTCLLSCQQNDDCKTAETAVGLCVEQKCASACGGGSEDAGNVVTPADGGSTTGGGAVACYESAASICVTSVLTATECADATGTAMSTCPTANLAGCCSVAGIMTCSYSPMTAAEVMQECSAENGTFATSP